jgi:hypothetical protein
MTEISTAPQQYDGPPADTNPQEDYFGFSMTEKFYLPDGQSYFELAAMNEGKKAKFQKMTQRDMVLEKGSGNARFKIDPAVERHALIQACTVDWNLKRNGVPQPFGERALRDFLELANPDVVEKIELQIRKMNPWLLNEMTTEEIDKQIEELKELREVAEKREAGEASSSNR